jgi:hypothetical protein
MATIDVESVDKRQNLWVCNNICLLLDFYI